MATTAPLDPRLIVRTYWSEANKGRGAYARTARRHGISPEWARQLVKRYPNTPRPVVDYVNLTPIPVRTCQFDPLLVRLILAPEPKPRDITKWQEMNIGVLVVLYATIVTVLCCVVLPLASLVVVPSWVVLLRELDRALMWERAPH